MDLIEQSTVLDLNYNVIDADHAEFVVLVNKLNKATNADFILLFTQLMDHTEIHFNRENKLMEQYQFPATAEHKGEHQRILAEFKQFKRRVDKGLVQFGRSFVTSSLPEWFDLHVKTMDSALVSHIDKNTHRNQIPQYL